jgi:hypothetical protein
LSFIIGGCGGKEVKSKVILALLALIYLICSISSVSAGKETQLTYGQRSVIGTAVYGNIVTWSEIATDGVHYTTWLLGRKLVRQNLKEKALMYRR